MRASQYLLAGQTREGTSSSIQHYALPYEVPKQRPGDPMHNPRKITGEAKIGDQCFCSKVIIVKYSGTVNVKQIKSSRSMTLLVFD